MPSIDQLAVEQFSSQPPAEIVSLFQPLMEVIQPAMGTISKIVGGLFGLYLIFIIARLYYERRKVKLLKNINYDLDFLNQHFNLPYSQEKKTPKKMMPLEKLKRLNEEKERKVKEKLEKGEKKKKVKKRRFLMSKKFPISIKLKEKQEKTKKEIK